MSTQRATSALTAGQRSIHPGLPGLPWWTAVVIALTATVVGVGLDAPNKELTGTFGTLYALGCVVAVLAVRRSGIFTAVIQPPLILFCAVPGAYWLFHGAAFAGVKAILINCGYPLIERFPLMLFTTAGVLLIGVARWYLGRAATAERSATTGEVAAGHRRLAAIVARLTAAFDSRRAATATRTTARRPRSADRPRRTASGPRATGAAQRQPAPTRSRQVRSTADNRADRRDDRSRERRPNQLNTDQPPRRRPRPPQDSDRRRAYPPNGRSTGRGDRMSPYQPGRSNMPPGVSTRGRQSPSSAAGANTAFPTHHPVSRVRYRGAEPDA